MRTISFEFNFLFSVIFTHFFIRRFRVFFFAHGKIDSTCSKFSLAILHSINVATSFCRKVEFFNFFKAFINPGRCFANGLTATILAVHLALLLKIMKHF